MLINNAGLFTVGSISKTTTSAAMLICNVFHPVLLCKTLLSRMLERKERSGVINVSSISSCEPVAGFTLYACTKNFLSSFSEGLQQELQLSGNKIDLLDYAPGVVATQMAGGRKGFFVIETQEAAKVSLDELSRVNRTHGTFNHYLVTLHRHYLVSHS